MNAPDRIRIQHMIDALAAIEDFVRGGARADLDTDRQLLFALARAVEIVGEAGSRVSEETRALAPEIPWAAITGMRNRLIHAYFDLDPDILWNTATVSAPDLLGRLQALSPKDASPAD